MDELLKEAAILAGREVELEQTTDGKWIVLWMQFEKPPPPKADTQEDALKGFIEMMKNRPKEDTDVGAE